MRHRISAKALALLLGICLTTVAVQAQSDYGEYGEILPVKGQSALTFMKIGMTPRAVAMGDAFSAMNDGIDAVFYNPGALGFAEKGEYLFSYTKWLVESELFTGALSMKLGQNTIGVTLISFRPQEVAETTILQATGTGRMVRGGDTSLGLIFSRQMTDLVSWGVQARYVQEDLVLRTTSVLQFDLGISAYTGYRSLRISAAARNVGADFKVNTEQYEPPINFNFGLAAEVFGEKGDPTYLTLAAETVMATDFGQRWNFGGELWLGNMFAFRGGYKVNTDIEEYTLGAGIKYPMAGRDVRVDVSYSDGGEFFDAPLRAGLSGTF